MLTPTCSLIIEVIFHQMKDMIGEFLFNCSSGSVFNGNTAMNLKKKN